MGNCSIYIHLPFCASKCPYCDFHSRPVKSPRFAAYRRALIAEWRASAPLFGDAPPISIYLGGGTPSIWPAEELVALLSSLPVAEGAEVTVETNPGSLSPAWLSALKEGGVNRVSIGVQALSDRRLRLLGRTHTGDEALSAVQAARREQMASVSADIIFGTPGQTPGGLAEELEQLADAGVDHVSAYELTYADETPFGRAKQSGAMAPLEEDSLITLWHTVQEVLSLSGIRQYEVSNHAKPGHESRHNSHYWTGGVYAGIGSGAHGLFRTAGRFVRYANSTDIDAYIAHWTKNPTMDETDRFLLRNTENLSLFDIAKERMMLGLRTTKGVKFKDVIELVPEARHELWSSVISKTISRGLVRYIGDYIVPTPNGLLLADAIAEEFF